jgi:hypothetical protein
VRRRNRLLLRSRHLPGADAVAANDPRVYRVSPAGGRRRHGRSPSRTASRCAGRDALRLGRRCFQLAVCPSATPRCPSATAPPRARTAWPWTARATSVSPSAPWSSWAPRGPAQTLDSHRRPGRDNVAFGGPGRTLYITTLDISRDLPGRSGRSGTAF